MRTKCMCTKILKRENLKLSSTYNSQFALTLVFGQYENKVPLVPGYMHTSNATELAQMLFVDTCECAHYHRTYYPKTL